MRIAQVAPLYESVPPKLYGGTERVVSYLTEELVRQGHEVTLFASGDSRTNARLVAGCPRALWQEPGCLETLPHHVRLVTMVVREADRFDLIHFHLDYLHFPVVGRLPCPTVTTLHGRLYPPDQEALFDAYPDVPLVSISDDQRRPIPRANWRATIYHGLPLDLHTPRDAPGTYLAFLGRISPEKGLEKAIEIARRAGMTLRVAAKIYPEERTYYEREIAPLLRASPWVEFVGEVGGAAKDAFLGGASALLFPIEWAEPFGLVMIEAIACGTPVIAFRRGSVPEVMVEGVTGFVVDNVAEAVEAVGRVSGLSRRLCRQVFAQRYGADRMARDYQAVYRNLVSEKDWTASQDGRPLNASHPTGAIPNRRVILGPVEVGRSALAS
ncbi:Glycosyltransferase involved in cell wall bisynthesis [Singulisphaera sp. GP187]|uniref:glycosyltransferase family 4 protein n=1 Tax=Singulisphaera sp. GP187 TaxID=1882752 RepID=UPI00092BCF98|nr:glycosyltransferase family 4 protein [Singulisphaera sp. GP187]SIO61776.1 Glycosyltransferase involved in cell wall bisynthesis [Singulisphaera sp. GP187]